MAALAWCRTNVHRGLQVKTCCWLSPAVAATAGMGVHPGLASLRIHPPIQELHPMHYGPVSDMFTRREHHYRSVSAAHVVSLT